MLQLNQNTNDLNIVLNNINNLEMGGNELIVTAPTGSTVTATKDGVTKTANEENGVYTFTGLEAGEWTVTLSNGINSVFKNMTVVAETGKMSFGSLPSFTYNGTYTLKKASDYGLSTTTGNGDYEVLALLESGSLTFDSAANVDLFIVGGGGGGGYWIASRHGGGGGGGYTTTAKNIAINTSPITVTIGKGGSGGTSGMSAAGTGGTSSILNYSATGGTGGNGYTGGSGGSGGSSPTGVGSSFSNATAGGTNGGNGNGANPGSGQGTTTKAFGESTATAYSGGGGSGGNGAGGNYGGGTGASSSTLAQSGITNSGGGGGGGAYGVSLTNAEKGAAGGSGIILIRRHI